MLFLLLNCTPSHPNHGRILENGDTPNDSSIVVQEWNRGRMVNGFVQSLQNTRRQGNGKGLNVDSSSWELCDDDDFVFRGHAGVNEMELSLYFKCECKWNWKWNCNCNCNCEFLIALGQKVLFAEWEGTCGQEPRASTCLVTIINDRLYTMRVALYSFGH